jgi:hypothetical protein
MADTAIITQKELNYIETLYLYANLNEFINPVDFPEIDGHGAYIIMMKWVHDNLLVHAELLSSTPTKIIYRLPNYRLLISEYDIAKKSNTFNVEIQYTQAHMFDVRDDITKLDLPFDGTHEQYHIKRIDVCKVAKHEEDYLSHKGFISTYKTIDRKGTGTKTETVYLGHRKNGNVLRMYNKTVELLTNTPKHPISYPKIALFSSYFGDIENLYTYELELHRKVLKANLGIDTLAQIDKAKIVYNAVVGKVRIYDDTEHNRKLIKQKKRERIEAHTITTYKEYKRETVEKYTPSLEYLKRNVNKQITNYMVSSKMPQTDQNRLKIYNYVMSDQMTDAGYDMVITYESTHLTDELSEMKEKHERIRDGNDELQSESNEAFGRIKSKDKQADGELYKRSPKASESREENGNDECYEQRVWNFDTDQDESLKDGKESEAKSSSQ